MIQISNKKKKKRNKNHILYQYYTLKRKTVRKDNLYFYIFYYDIDIYILLYISNIIY